LADLSKANLSGADLTMATVAAATLCRAKLVGSNLTRCNFVEADFSGANLTGCRVYGLSAWGLKLADTTQRDLIISRHDETEITSDNIELAQFIYLLLHSEKIRDVIDTIGKKAVLILGRFTPERKAILDALRNELRKLNYLPILFDFNRPATRDITETISLLAHMSRFVLADLTNAKSIPQELSVIVPHLPSVPVQPLLHKGSKQYSMFEHFQRYPNVLQIYEYRTKKQLIADLRRRVISPAEASALELQSPNRTSQTEGN
jgi:uncharacterized protein YjbI with pentapeptide repeats